VTDDLEIQADSDSDDSDDGVYNGGSKRVEVKQRVWWLVKAFMWFSALFFPTSVLSDYGFLSGRSSANALSVDHESGLPSIMRIEFRLTG